MTSQILQITSQQNGVIRMSPDEKEFASVHEIPSECIRAGQLNMLLRSLFPAGGYNVDVDQDVYKIRTPGPIPQLKIPNFRKW
ncbi:predicted protein [Chaetomium globosum CBS 148.51]|uniref:Uncharacterized protein n=1 Tax=Chaetomium globosum (strain ATCC 6205 / CBS 148.51 / DSM 1962 / NBRC 6347 / NRRL 1970) TaxID=306901 RepID=Q2H1Y6_CHAGB|nr:uncharacterized protein CHGG_04210 [Chaetomium globosum CBS 148.51]EAQ87591.1 predicted protein [Chaetomium globosum CBS 148.51]